jgi:hypothetical protein
LTVLNGTWSTPVYAVKDANGFVRLYGSPLLTAGSFSNAFQLPVGYRPASPIQIPMYYASGTNNVFPIGGTSFWIGTDGVISKNADTWSNNYTYNFSCIEFYGV